MRSSVLDVSKVELSTEFGVFVWRELVRSCLFLLVDEMVKGLYFVYRYTNDNTTHIRAKGLDSWFPALITREWTGVGIPYNLLRAIKYQGGCPGVLELWGRGICLAHTHR